MTTTMRTTMVTLSGLVLLLVAGCAGFLRPEPGMMAQKEARIALAENMPQATWETGDLRVNYTMSAKGGNCVLEGRLVINDTVTNSFPIITKLFFYLSFLDQDGRVVETVDISPVIPAYGNTPASLPLKMTKALPAQVKYVAFHYYGGFRANPLSEGEHWDIHHFPFGR